MIRPLSFLTRSEKGFGRTVLIFMGLGFLALVIAGGAAALVAMRNEENMRLVSHTREVEAAIGDFAQALERAETTRRGYLLDTDPRFLAAYEEARGAIPPQLDHILALTVDNPAQAERATRIAALAERQLQRFDQSIAMARQGQRALAIEEFRSGASVDATRQLRVEARTMVANEARLLAERTARQSTTVKIFYVVLAIAGILVLIVGTASIVVILRYTRDLSTSRDALRRLNENLEDAVKERTTDLQRANDEIQRFAYIVSHDLRSPLVNVMGFTAELDAARKPILEFVDGIEDSHPGLAPEAVKLAAREDLPEAIGFIRSSTQKMDRLINAILTLSRQGRRTLAPEKVEVGSLAQGIADAMQHKVTEMGAEIRIAPDLPSITTDRLALEQILSNLVENAVKYLKPGRPGIIRVEGRRERDRVIYSVIDNGRGIDPRDHERIFDLFRRSGAQDQPGEGIGLAHVRALVYRLGGLISCQSELDQGATFSLSLPPAFQGEAGQ